MPMNGADNTIKKDYLWNTVGSGIYALSSMFLAFAAMNIAGPDDGGIFGFGFSTFGQQMFIIAYFGIRPFHITDSSYEYSFTVYSRLRNITSIVAAAAALFYLATMFLTGSYSLHKASIVMLLALYKIADGVADVYESECQRAGVLWLSGQELSLRTLLAAAVLIGVMAVTKDVLVSCAAAVVMQYACVIAFRYYMGQHVLKTSAASYADAGHGSKSDEIVSENIDAVSKEKYITAVNISRNENTAEKTSKEKLGTITFPELKLARSTVLLFLSVFIDFYIFSAAKYAVDRFLTDADNGIFNILFMPTSVIYLVANFIIRPYMTRLSVIYARKNYAEFEAVLKKLLLAVIALSAAAIAGALVLGKPVLKILEYFLGAGYSGALSSKSLLFVFIIAGGCCYAVSNLYYYILIIMRQQKMIFAIYCGIAVIACVLSNLFVFRFGLSGAAFIYPCYMLVATVTFALCCKGIRSSRERHQ